MQQINNLFSNIQSDGNQTLDENIADNGAEKVVYQVRTRSVVSLSCQFD